MNAKKANENVFDFIQMKDAFIENIVDILDASFHKSEYINECKTELLKLKQEKFQKTIAIIGRTGSGKSSLLNALLNQESFLPISQASACTAVPVEISANFLNANYEADVQFVSEAEWDIEMKIRKRCNDDFKPERLPYNSALVSSYKPISDVLVEDFIEKISRYISAVPKELSQLDDDDDDELYNVNECDFVKCVKIRIPNSDICSCGITLVDLPGKGDTHAVRNRIASEYINKCNAIWIVSPIIRAMSDDIQTSIDDEFLQKLLMESRYGTLSFICTKTDDIDVNNYIQEKKLQKNSREEDPVKANVVRLKLALKDVEKTISENEKRRKQLNKDPTLNALDLDECTKVHLVSVGQKCEINQKLREICIKDRNHHCRIHLERILKSRLSKLIPDKQLTASQVPNVFCVSAKDYKESKERYEESSEDRTGISDLANHEKTAINLRIEQFKESTVHRLIERILMIVNSLSDFVKAEPDIQITAKKLFLAQRNLLKKSIRDIQNDNMNEIREKYLSLMAAVDRGIQKSVANANNIVESWEINYKYNTYQATIRRYGEYCSRGKVGKVDFNYQLCQLLSDSILPDWLLLFEIPVDLIYLQILTAVNDFYSQLHRELSTAPFSMYVVKLPSCTAFQIKSDIDCIEIYTKSKEQVMHAMIKRKVKEYMEAAYELCLNVDSGKSRFEKMNSVVKDHVNAISKELFDTVGSTVRTEIELWIASVEEMLQACRNRLFSDISSTHEPIFEKIESKSDKILIGRSLLKCIPELKLLYSFSLNSDSERLYLELIEKCELLSQTNVEVKNTASSLVVHDRDSTNFSSGDVFVCDVKVERPTVSDDNLKESELNSKERTSKPNSTAAHIQSSMTKDRGLPKSSTGTVKRNATIEPRTPVEKLAFSAATINAQTGTPSKTKRLIDTSVLNPLDSKGRRSKPYSTAAHIQSSVTKDRGLPKSSTGTIKRNPRNATIEHRTPGEKLAFSAATINAQTGTPSKTKRPIDTPVFNPLGNLSVDMFTPSASADIKQDIGPLPTPTKRRRISAPIVIDDDD